jgi:hypothetical protein
MARKPESEESKGKSWSTRTLDTRKKGSVDHIELSVLETLAADRDASLPESDSLRND